MNLLVTEEAYGWARRKVIEAKVALANYLGGEDKDGNTDLVRSLEDVKQALLYLDFGHIGEGQEAMQGSASSYYRLIEYIDGVIAASNLLEERSMILYDATSNLVAVAEELVGQARHIWGFDA